MAASDVNCAFLKEGNCRSIVDNYEAKEVRMISCSNQNLQACCYLCSRYQGCKISCNFLGENKNQPTTKQPTESFEDNKLRVLSCPLCGSRMLNTKMSLRAGDWEGFTKGLPLGIGEIGEISEELLPVIIYVCPKCGKLEFMAQEKTKQKIIDKY